MFSTIIGLTGLLWAQSPTVGDWIRELGPPTKSVEQTERIRTDDEPLLLYWIQAKTAPLGVGPEIPGTLVANFTAEPEAEESKLASFMFLGNAKPEQRTALVASLKTKGWVKDEKLVQRPGGLFKELFLQMRDGRQGTVALRQGSSKRGMADGRPSPSLWIYIDSGALQEKTKKNAPSQTSVLGSHRELPATPFVQ